MVTDGGAWIGGIPQPDREQASQKDKAQGAGTGQTAFVRLVPRCQGPQITWRGNKATRSAEQ